MRYDPATDRAKNIDALAAESREILSRAKDSRAAAAPEAPQVPTTTRPIWGELVQAGLLNRSWATAASAYHASEVAKAMGNHAGARMALSQARQLARHLV
jgi:hypothetical protein